MSDAFIARKFVADELSYSCQKYFNGKMRRNVCIFRGHSLSPIEGGSLD